MTKERCSCKIKKTSGFTLMADPQHPWFGYWVHSKCLNPLKAIKKQKGKIPSGFFDYTRGDVVLDAPDED